METAKRLGRNVYCAKVLHASIEPESRPLRNHIMRCSELPCVKESGFTCPWPFSAAGHLHGGSRAKRGLDIALLEQPALLRRMRPNPAKHRLQFHLHGKRFLCTRVLLLQLAQLALDAQDILHVVAQFVREYVGLREFAGAPKRRFSSSKNPRSM